MRRSVAVVLLVLFPWLPIIKSQPALVQSANLAGEYALISISLVILTGWVGQISLGQGAFVGIGAFATGMLARKWGIPFPLNMPIVAVISAAVAVAFGTVALRVRGLYLAVATLIFAYMADKFLFKSAWLVGEGGSSTIANRTIGRPGTFTFFDFRNKEVFYLVVIASVAAAIHIAVNLRDSKTGRAFFAVRGSEMAAVSLGIDVTRYKLLAFALSGALAGFAGNLMMTDLRTASPVNFDFTKSLFFLGIAVVGGVSSLGGAIGASALFAFLNAVGQISNSSFARGISNNIDIAAVLLLLLVLLAYPGGLGEFSTMIAKGVNKRSRVLLERLHRLWPRAKPKEGAASDAPGTISHRRRASLPLPSWMPKKKSVRQRSLDFSQLEILEPEPTTEELAIIGSVAARVERREWRDVAVHEFELPAERADRTPILETSGVVVRFGGLIAANHVSLQVREHEIVGLIGPNGAGKTTTFNAISGLNQPSSGTIRLFGEDVTGLPVHRRAQMGVGRTFQLIQLFPQLSVFDNLLVATHSHNPTGFVSHIALTGGAIEAEKDARKNVRQVVAMLGLEEVADRRVAGLPFGILRHIELARALVTRSPLMMLDEPASGLDNNETEEFAKLLRFIRAELGVSILLIEHDVRMVTSVCDYIYVINGGAPLAEGTPAEIQRNPDVIAAYLGKADTAESIDA